MRLTLIISSLSSGGAERVMSIIANYWAVKEWKITLLTFNHVSKAPFYPLHPCINYIPLNIANQSPNRLVGIWNNLKRIFVLRTAISISKPDAIISFLDTTNVLTLLATRGLKIPVIVSERNEPGKCQSRMWGKLRHLLYPLANQIVVQTERAKNYFSLQLQSRICVIPNPVLLPKTNCVSQRLLKSPSLIAVGRLEQQKGFDLLIKAFSKVKDTYAEWTLTILGEGPLRSELEYMLNDLKLNEHVHLIGRVKDPYAYLKQADIFVMSSRFEGFPNALCEAMASGLPVISTDCPYGPREIIRNNVDGILVPNEDLFELATAIARLMSDEQERKNLAKHALEVITRFNVDDIMKDWETILGKVI